MVKKLDMGFKTRRGQYPKKKYIISFKWTPCNYLQGSNSTKLGTTLSIDAKMWVSLVGTATYVFLTPPARGEILASVPTYVYWLSL